MAAIGPGLFQLFALALLTLPALVDVVGAAAVIGPAILTPQCSDKGVQLNYKEGGGESGAIRGQTMVCTYVLYSMQLLASKTASSCIAHKDGQSDP